MVVGTKSVSVRNVVPNQDSISGMLGPLFYSLLTLQYSLNYSLITESNASTSTRGAVPVGRAQSTGSSPPTH
jgi:hypothetical protein